LVPSFFNAVDILTGSYSTVPSRPASSQVIAQLELWNERTTGRYEKKVYVLPKHLDEKVAALHLPKLGAKLTKLSADQAAYINVPVTGPFKPAHYRYGPKHLSRPPTHTHSHTHMSLAPDGALQVLNGR
jgi:hypothetical protein